VSVHTTSIASCPPIQCRAKRASNDQNLWMTLRHHRRVHRPHPQRCLARPRRFWVRSTHSRNGRGGADFPRDPSCGSAGVLCGFRHLSENHGPTRQ
jgi:hypothetical protein